MATSVSPRFGSSKVAVLHNGVDTNKIRPASEDLGYCLYLGRLSHEKGIATLVRAHGQMRRRTPLKVCGTGPLLESLREAAPANVEFLGYRTGEDLDEIIRGASVIVVPSVWYENCPISVLEAMAYGKPVVASRIGGIPELVEDGVSGLLYSPGDSEELAERLDTVMSDESLRRRYGIAGRARAERLFSLDLHNTGLMSHYQRLLSPSGKAKQWT